MKRWVDLTVPPLPLLPYPSLYDKLMMLFKATDKRNIVRVMLKNGRFFLEQFLKVAMPFSDQHFKTHKVRYAGVINLRFTCPSRFQGTLRGAINLRS